MNEDDAGRVFARAGRWQRAAAEIGLTYSDGMPLDIAFIEYSNDVNEWRLFSPNRDKMAPLPPTWQSVLNGGDVEHVNRTLRSWGYRRATEGWKQDGSRWVVPVQRRERE